MKNAVVAAGLLAWSTLTVASTGMVYVPARLVQEREPKKFPAAGGWVHVSYIVKVDGSVGEPIVLDSNGSKAIEEAVLAAVSQWRYEPATLNGTPVPQRLEERLSQVKLSADNPATLKKFDMTFRHVIQLIEDRHYEAAELDLIRARDGNTVTSAGWARIHLLWSYIDAGRGNKERQVEHLQTSIDSAREWNSFLITDVEKMVRTLFKVQVELKRYREALITYADLKRTGGLDDEGQIERTARQLSALITGTGALAVEGQIEQRGAGTSNSSWNYEILRRRIAFTEVAGALDTFELRCTTHIYSDKVDTEREWTLPESWGDCMLLVFGQPGTRFKLLELSSVPQ